MQAVSAGEREREREREGEKNGLKQKLNSEGLNEGVSCVSCRVVVEILSFFEALTTSTMPPVCMLMPDS